MGAVVGVMHCNTREHVLKGFARHQIPVLQRRLAEDGQEFVTAAIENDGDAAIVLLALPLGRSRLDLRGGHLI